MTYDEEYLRQVQVLLSCLPAIRSQEDFAIKGGTAINLFIQNLPRLSVDIDLTYRHLNDRDTSLRNMQNCLIKIANNIKKANPEYNIRTKLSRESALILKLMIYGNGTFIKVEPNFNMRGTLFPIEFGELSAGVSEKFNACIDKVPILSKAEVYAGKICAALNRQHPRDLFDIMLLLENGGISDDMRQAFVVYGSCDMRPIHELLAPNRLDVTNLFNNEFQRMTEYEVNLNALLQAREELIDYLAKSLTDNERQFLLSVKRGMPEYSLLSFKNIDQLPALQWKVMNIQKMSKDKHAQMIEKLKAVLKIQ